MNKVSFVEKAEAYVRSQLPELMELSFGCEVRAMHNDTGSIFYDVINQRERLGIERCRYEKLPDWYGGSHFITHGYLQTKDERIVGKRGMENIFRLVEVIGHPIHLQHWLRVLGNEGFTYALEVYIPHGPCIRVVQAITRDEWLIKINLITGQPKEEADYQAICNILGI